MVSGQTIAVVGAGMAGLTAAQLLQARGASVCVFEKSRGPGGRMSTRRRDLSQFDHGAQYFTARSVGFSAAVREWERAGVVAPWPGQFCRWTDGELETESGSPTRWVGTPRMSALTRHLSAGCSVMSGCRVVNAQRAEDGWWLSAEDGAHHGPFDSLVLTCPGPQAALLAPAQSAVYERAMSLTYSPCWAAMISVKSHARPPFSGCHCEHPVVGWIAHDSSKPGRPAGGHWVLHAQARWSAENQEAPADVVGSTLRAAFEEMVGIEVESVQVHRWLYALSDGVPGSTMVYDPDCALGLCGDGLAGTGVEDAWQSAFDLVRVMDGRGD
jgi:renalase